MNLIKECEHFDYMAMRHRQIRRLQVLIVVQCVALAAIWAYAFWKWVL